MLGMRVSEPESARPIHKTVEPTISGWPVLRPHRTSVGEPESIGSSTGSRDGYAEMPSQRRKSRVIVFVEFGCRHEKASGEPVGFPFFAGRAESLRNHACLVIGKCKK